VLVGENELARLFEADTGWEVRRFESRASPVDQVAPSMDGAYLLARIYDFETRGEVQCFWDLADGRAFRLPLDDAPRSEEQVDTHVENEVLKDALAKEQRSILAYSHSGSVTLSQNGVVFSRATGQGSLLLTQNDNGDLDLRDAISGQVIRGVEGEPSFVETGVFSPDNSRVIIGHRDNTASLVDVATGKELHRLRGHTNWVTSVGFFREGQFIYTGGRDGMIRIWDGQTGDPVVTLVAFRDGGWAVLDAKGHYDASIPDAEPGLYGQSGDKTVPIGQLREQFYVPNLLAKRLGTAAK
jgi:WD40 repeat protein